MSKKKEIVPSIGRLPEEMQAYILSKLDGKTAIIAKRVCKLWRKIVHVMESCMHFWLRRCLKEIPPHALVELSRLMSLSSDRDKTLAALHIDWRSSLDGLVPWMFWREVYAEYYRCCYIKKGTYKKVELHFFPLYGEVTCLHIQDNDIFSGHESGAVMCWSNIESELSSEILYRHDRRVTSITGINNVSTVTNILQTEFNSKIVSSSKDSTLKVHCMDTENTHTIKHYSKTVNCVRSWGSRFVAAADKIMIQGQPVWNSPYFCDTQADTICTLFSDTVANVKAVAFWEEIVISGDEAGNLFYWKGCADCKKLTNKEGMSPVASLGSSVKTLILLGSRLIAFTADKQLHVGGKNITEDHKFKSHNIYNAIKNTPECIAVRCSILAIGCKGGKVFLYHIPDDNSWDSLNLEKPSQLIKTSVDHVNDIAIGDDGGGPVIVIATSGYCIHVIQFRRQKQTALESKNLQ